MENIAEGLIREFDELYSGRANFNSHCGEIADRIMPSHSNMFVGGNFTKGDKRTKELFDSTAAIALGRFGAILDSLLTPRNQKWHRLSASDEYLNKRKDVRLYFEQANAVLFKARYAPKANFVSQNQKAYKSLGAYGNAITFIDELNDRSGDRGLRYKDIHLSEGYFSENHQGIVDKLVRKFKMTARAIEQKWPETCGDKVKNIKTKETEFEIIHCVKEREDWVPGRLDSKGMRYASYYALCDGKILLSEGGFSSFPYAVSRYEQESGETTGRSPAMEILPAVKTLNEQKKTVLKQGHRIVDPIYLVADDGIIDSFSARPGSMVAGGVTAEGRPLVHTLPTGNLMAGKEMMDDERAVINDAFLVTLFQILTETPTMTATEVLERTKEKGILLAPTIGRQESERLGPMIERELDVLASLGLLPQMPPILLEARGEYSVIYDSPLSRIQRAEEASGLMRSIEMALQVVNVTQNPEPLDHYNWDIIIPDINDIQGVPERWSRSMEEVSMIRASRAEAAQEQLFAQQAPGAAALVNAGAKMKKNA